MPTVSRGLDADIKSNNNTRKMQRLPSENTLIRHTISLAEAGQNSDVRSSSGITAGQQ